MQAAIIHGGNAILSASVPNTNHFQILKRTEMVAYRYATFLRDVSGDEIAQEFGNFENDRDVWQSLLAKKKKTWNFGLQGISAVTDEKFDDWFIDEFMKVHAGIQKDSQRYWWQEGRRIRTEAVGAGHRVGAPANTGKTAAGFKQPNTAAVDPTDMEEAIRRSLIDQNRKPREPFIMSPDVLGEDGVLFERYHVKGDGNCGFYVMSIGREDAARLVRAYLANDKQDRTINSFLVDEFGVKSNAEIVAEVLKLSYYATTSVLMIIAKAKSWNIQFYRENRDGKAEDTGIKYRVTDPKKDVKILQSGTGANAHYDLLVNIGDHIEGRRGRLLEQKCLERNLDRSYEKREAFLR